jgi:hypothetical protein
MNTCPKCGAESGDDWSQCEGSCPIPASPHYRVSPPRCESCGINPADPPSKLCVGCQAYREH